MIKIGKIRISLLCIPFFIFAFLSGAQIEFAAAYLSLFIHEAAHFLCAARLGVPFRYFTLMPFGACISLDERKIKEPAYEVLICAAGPAANLIFSIFILLIFKNTVPFLKLTSDYCLSIGLLNLIPVFPLDGGRIFKAILGEKTGFFYAAKICSDISVICIILTLAFCVILLFKNDFSPRTAVLCAFMIFSLSTSKRNDRYYEMLKISDYKRKLANRKMMKCVHIAAFEGADRKKLLNAVSYNAYYVFDFYSEDGDMLYSLSETRLIESFEKNQKKF